MNLTAAQIKVIQTWTEQRDALQREIGIYTTQLDDLKKDTKQEGLNLAALHVSIGEAKGRIAEIDALETRMRGSIATDISELEIRKSRLEGECVALDTRLEAGAHQYAVITTAVANLESAHKIMEDQSAIVNRVVGEIIQTSQVHTSEMKVMMEEVRAVADGVIVRGNENLSQTKIILDKLPRYIFELQKPIPVRRAYAAERGTEIKPE